MRVLFFMFFSVVTHFTSAQISLDKLRNSAVKAQEAINRANLSESQVTEGLKEALVLGASKSVENTSKSGGFNNNQLIKISFPEDALKMKQGLLKIGMNEQVERFEYVLNEAAEDASNSAKEIFVNAIVNMTIQDAMSILNGEDDAATNYLSNQTSEELFLNFLPVISNSIEKVNLTKYWEKLVHSYNKIPFTKPVNEDLDVYVTNQAIHGLFVMIAIEEKKIRNNPKARVSEILKKVFK